MFCEFNTGETRLIDLTDKVENIAKPMMAVLAGLPIKSIKTVKLDSYVTLVWANEVDFCPDVLYEMSTDVELI